MIVRASTKQAQDASILTSASLDWLNQLSSEAKSRNNAPIPTQVACEIAELITKQDISPAAEAVIREVLEKSPTRRPQGHGGNWKGIYQSRKMRCGIFFESLGEYALILRLEHDPNVIAYFAQPPSMLLRYAGPTGKRTGAQHTPDFFVITRTGLGWIEVKPDEKLAPYEDGKSERFKKINDIWTCPPGIAFALQFGFTYEVHTSSSIQPNFVRNARFLDSYLGIKTPIRQLAVDSAAHFIAKNPSITLLKLLIALKDHVSDDEIYRLIVSGHIHFDWNRALLIEPEAVLLFADPKTMTAFYEGHSDEPVDPGAIDVVTGGRILVDGVSREILNVGVRSITLSTPDKCGQDLPYQTFRRMVEDGAIRPDPSSPSRQYHPFVLKRMLEATDDELAVATRRARWIRAHLRDGAGKPKHVSDRSWRRWLKEYRDAEEAFGNGFIGLIPDTHKRGNHKPRIGEELYQRLSKHIGTHYETPDAPNATICWSLFREESIKHGLQYCDLDTYCRVISLRNIGTQTLLRKGARAARKYERWYQPSSGPSLPKKADRPWEKAHIDHTEIDLETPYGSSNEYKDRCWLTAMVDDCTGAVLAHVLSLNRTPNTVSVQLLFRDCVRRHRRLPEAIVVDNAHEFDSIAIEKLCSFLDIDKFSRPEGQPKYGSLGERLFGATNTHCLHNLRGNTKIMKEVRQVTKSFNPKNRATWTFGPLYKLMDTYFYQIANNLVGPSGSSPNDAFEELMARYGTREHRLRPYDQLFIMMTSPTTKKGRAKVIPSRGVWITHCYYNCDTLDDPSLYNKQVPVRSDPDDVGTAWVCVHKRWVECHSQYYAEFHGRSVHQIRIATQKIREGRTKYNHAQKTINPSLLAQFFRETKDYEKLLQQEARDRAMQAAREALAPQKDCYEGTWQPGSDDSAEQHIEPGDDSKTARVNRNESKWPKRKDVVGAERARNMASAV